MTEVPRTLDQLTPAWLSGAPRHRGGVRAVNQRGVDLANAATERSSTAAADLDVGDLI